jgi:predicted membrane protein
MVTPMVAATRPPHGPARRSRRGSADGQVLGGLLVIGGIARFLNQVGVVGLSLTTTLSCLLITLGIGLVLTARRTGGAGLVLVGLILTVVLASTSAVDVGLLQRGVGDRTFTPQPGDRLPAKYQLGVGSLTVDLSELTATDLAGKKLDLQVGVGEVVVLLPSESVVPVDMTGTARAGQVDLLGQGSQDGGTNVVEHTSYGVQDRSDALTLDLDVGLGHIQVVRPPGR